MKSLVIIGFLMMSLQAGAAVAKTYCGQKLNVKPVPMSPQVSPALKSFSGVWVGTISVNSDYAPCTTFVVEQIEPTGVVQVLQAWGTDHTASGFQVGLQYSGKLDVPWAGQVTNRTLSLQSQKVSYLLDLDPVNPNKMTGYEISKAGRFPVTLTRTEAFY